MEKDRPAFLEALRKSMRQIRSLVGATVINPGQLTSAARLQYEGQLRCKETNASVMALFKNSIRFKRIVKRAGLSGNIGRCIDRGLHSDIFRTRQSSREEQLLSLDA